MDSKEQSDALWIVIRDAVQLLNVAYLWKVPVDEQWRMSYQELTERINKLSGRPETPEARPAPSENTEGLRVRQLASQLAQEAERGGRPDRERELMREASAALHASPSAPSEGVPSVRETRVLKAALRYWAENDDERIDEAYEELMDAASDLASSAYVLHPPEPSKAGKP